KKLSAFLIAFEGEDYMSLTEFRRRKLDSFLLCIQIIRKEVLVKYKERICKKYFYTFIESIFNLWN
ncbi:MAG: hypothetical protein PHX04_02135, partial [Bacilli bacterium]|nr:hypothetical protein [Bacilli bacterium]